MLQVPEPYAASAARLSDIETIWRLLVAINLDESGTPGWGLGEVESWLTGESIDIEQDVVLVENEGGVPVAVALFDSRRAVCATSHLGRRDASPPRPGPWGLLWWPGLGAKPKPAS